MSLKIEHAHLVLPYQVLQDAWLISREGKITAYGCGVSPQQTFSTVIDAKGQYLTPGFVDLHVHGGAGADFRDWEEAAFCSGHAGPPGRRHHHNAGHGVQHNAGGQDRKSTRLNSSHIQKSRMPSSA